MMPDTKTRSESHISRLGWVVLFMALVSLMLVLWTSYQDRVETQCQRQVNITFLNVMRERADIADGDRDAIRILVNKLSESHTAEQTDQFIKEYNAANRELDRERAALKFPTAADICN